MIAINRIHHFQKAKINTQKKITSRTQHDSELRCFVFLDRMAKLMATNVKRKKKERHSNLNE